jgi:hypothetical protein
MWRSPDAYWVQYGWEHGPKIPPEVSKRILVAHTVLSLDRVREGMVDNPLRVPGESRGQTSISY